MADFEIKVNDKAFQQLGIKPVIDENLYGELIDEYAPDAPGLDINIAPSILWSEHSISQRLRDIREGNALLPVGKYYANNKSIVLPAHPSLNSTNRLLRHETWHFIDDVNGESQESFQTMMHRLKGAMVLAGAGVALGFVSGKKGIAAAAAASPLVTLPATYWKAPHEIAARRFATDPAVKDKYGKIITYEST